MAALSFFGTNTTLESGTFQELSETSPGANATSSPATGWTVGTTTATNYSAFRAGTKRANNTFNTTAIPTSFAAADCFRSTNTYSGTIASGNWSFVFACIGVTNAGAQDGNIRIRVWRSPNADGSGATEITSAVGVGSTITNLSTTQLSSTVTFNPGAVTLNDEYIFVQAAWQISGPGGMSTTDVVMRVGGTATTLTTPNFVPARTVAASLTGPAGTLSATAAVHVDAGAALTGPAGVLAAEVTVEQGNAVTLGNATTLVDPAGNQSISKPSGVVEGTILVLCCNHETDNFTPPSGFTKRGNTAHWTFPFDWYQELFTKVAGASEPSSYSMTGGGYRDAWLVALNNVDPSSVVPSGGVTDNSGSGSTTTGLSATVARDGSLLLRFEASHTGTGRSGSPPTGMAPVNGNSPIDGSFYADYQSGLSAGSTGNKTATLTGSESWAVNMLVLQPPAEGEPGDIEATAELTGPSGTASAEAAVLVAAGAAITGPAGTVAGTASVVAEAQAAIAGPSGTLAANAAVPIDAAAILTGPAGVASAAGSVRIGIAAELTGPAGVLAATVLSEEPGVEVSAALTGPAGTLAAAATVAVSGALAATGPAGQLSAAAALPVAATAALVGPSGTLAATTDVPAAAVCALVGPSPSLSAVCAVRVAVAATITGPAGVLSASVGEPPREATAAIVGPSGTLTASVGVVIVAAATLVGAPGTCTAAVGAIAGAGAALVGPSGVVSAGAGVVAQGSLGIVGPAGVLSALIVEHIEPPLTRAPPTTSALVPGAAGGSRMLPVPRATSRSVS